MKRAPELIPCTGGRAASGLICGAPLCKKCFQREDEPCFGQDYQRAIRGIRYERADARCRCELFGDHGRLKRNTGYRIAAHHDPPIAYSEHIRVEA